MVRKSSSNMKKIIYDAPALTIDQTEPQVVIAMSLDTKDVEWKNDVDLEVKEQSNSNNIWDIEW